MLQFLFDTDHLTLFEQGHPQVLSRYAAEPIGSVGISPVTVEEALRGRLAVLSRQRGGPAMVLAYERLVNTVSLLRQFPVAAFDAACEAHYQQLRAMRLRVGTQDLKIAAVALVHNLTSLTRNRRDFALIPGLALDDWSV